MRIKLFLAFSPAIFLLSCIIASQTVFCYKEPPLTVESNKRTVSVKFTPKELMVSPKLPVKKHPISHAKNASDSTIDKKKPDVMNHNVNSNLSKLSGGFFDGFENTKIEKHWDTEFAPTTYSASVVKRKFSLGSCSFRSELNKDDPDVGESKRAEICLRYRESPCEEHWYAFSIYLPSSSAENYQDDISPEILAQWHNYPDNGEEWTSPPLSLETQNGNFYLRRYWDDAAITSNHQMESKGYFSSHDLGSYQNDKGKWTSWVFHIKWGWLSSQNPLLEVYKNGVKILECINMPNTTNDKSGIYFKIGLYKWDWKMHPSPSQLIRRVIYYDDISIDYPIDMNTR